MCWFVSYGEICRVQVRWVDIFGAASLASPWLCESSWFQIVDDELETPITQPGKSERGDASNSNLASSSGFLFPESRPGNRSQKYDPLFSLLNF